MKNSMIKWISIHVLLVLFYISFVELVLSMHFENPISIGILIMLMLLLHSLIFVILFRKYNWKWVVSGVIALVVVGIGCSLLIEKLVLQQKLME